MTSTRSEAAAAVSIGAGLALRKRAELLELLRPCFARTEPWLQAGKYAAAVMSELPERNGWSIARHAGDRTPDRTQRLLNHASWDTSPRWAWCAGSRWPGWRRPRGAGNGAAGLVIGAIDETGQEKAGEATAGVKRQYMGCAGRVANGINTVHLSYVREKTGHALIGARQWIPREHIEDPVKSLVMGLPLDLGFRTKGQLAIDICARCVRRRHQLRFRLRGRGLRQLHPAARVLRGQRPGLRAAGAVELHAHAGRGHEADLRGGGQAAAEGQAALGGPLRREGLQGRALVRLGVDRHRLRRAITCWSAAT